MDLALRGGYYFFSFSSFYFWKLLFVMPHARRR
jgi:hypothetical protein